MKVNILFIGTSHLSAIKRSFEKYLADEVSATFVAFGSADLAICLQKTFWAVEECNLRLNSKLVYFKSSSEKIDLRATSGNGQMIDDIVVKLTDYSHVIFVDMFFRARPPAGLKICDFTTINDRPISYNMLQKLTINGFNGVRSYKKHHKYGDIPLVDAKPFVKKIRQTIGGASFYLISAPRPPVTNVDVLKLYGSNELARKYFDWLEGFYDKSLSEIGVQYLYQPKSVLDPSGVLTRIEYSSRPHPTIPGFYDEHTGEIYGDVVVKEILNLIFHEK